MGSSCRLILPPEAEIKQVCTFITILLGNPVEYVPYPEREGGFYTAYGYEWQLNECAPQCVRVLFNNNLSYIGEDKEVCNYHFEASNGQKIVTAASDALWVSVFQKIAQAISGKVIWDDCNIGPNPPVFVWSQEKFKPDWLGKEDDASYSEQQKAIQGYQPLAIEEFQKTLNRYEWQYDSTFLDPAKEIWRAKLRQRFSAASQEEAAELLMDMLDGTDDDRLLSPDLWEVEPE